MLPTTFRTQNFSSLFTCNTHPPTFFALINFSVIKSITPPPPFLLLPRLDNLVFVFRPYIFSRREFGRRRSSSCPLSSGRFCLSHPGPSVPLCITSHHRIVQIVQTARKENSPAALFVCWLAFPEKCRPLLLHVNLILQYSKPLSFVGASN